MRYSRQRPACVGPLLRVNPPGGARGPDYHGMQENWCSPWVATRGEHQFSVGRPLEILHTLVNRRPAHLSQASTLSGFAPIHFSAAASGDMPSAVMYFATRFWSLSDQLNFLISR
jgi:hypothetical protein